MTYPTLPTYRGLPVPFVARREAEVPSDADPRWAGFGYSLGLDVLTGEKFPVLMNESLHRDEYGWLWQPSPEWDFDGKPQFAAVNSERHRLCMDSLLCQVCGQSAEADGESSWLLPLRDVPRDTSREIVAQHPPVCLDCLDVARHYCPHLRRTTWPHILARETRPWGVIGDTYDTSGNIIAHGPVNAQVDPHKASMTLARQRLLSLHDWSRA